MLVGGVLLLGLLGQQQPVYAMVPYIPSRLFFQSNHNSTRAYLLQPTANQHQQETVQLLALNLSHIEVNDPPFVVLQESVPFASDAAGNAWVAFTIDAGGVVVYAGHCREPQPGTIWTFHPDDSDAVGNGAWSSAPAIAGTGRSDGIGPRYLAGGFGFASSKNGSAPTLYTFGGLCPQTDDGDNNSDWVSMSNYSRVLTVLKPTESSSPSRYEVSAIEAKNAPVAEAGSAVTPLALTTSTTAEGKVLQQGDYLFLGGHTQDAFINISSLALLSLPQQAWSFRSMDPTVEDIDQKDIAVGSPDPVDSRSGHSAVMTTDRTRVVVYGGWIANTATPAKPQLVILNIPEVYGGTTPDWSWSVPSQPDGSDLSPGHGIFGHAAMMLPGDVMLIAGGYNIPASEKRAYSDIEANARVFLYNVTSNSWLSSYTHPDSETHDTSSSSGPLSVGGKVGVAVGSLAAALVILAVLLFFWRRKRWARRRFRERELRKLALGAERPHVFTEPGMAASYRGPGPMMEEKQRGSFLSNSLQPQAMYGGMHAATASEPEKMGLLVDNMPSPLRRGSHAAGSFHLARLQSYDQWRGSHGMGSIHPIDEREEFDMPPSKTLPREQCSPSRAKESYVDTLASHPASKHVDNIPQNRADHGERPSSESRDELEGTSSNPSDSPVETAPSILRSIADSARIRLVSGSDASGPSTKADSIGSDRQKPVETTTGQRDTAHHPVHHESLPLPFDQTSATDSFATAPTSLKRSWQEAETLLRTGFERDTSPPESPIRFSAVSTNLKQTSVTWMESLKRTFSRERFTPPTTPEGTAQDAVPPVTENEETPAAEVPRRPVSVSNSYLQLRRGPRDWAVDVPEDYFPGREDNAHDEDEDWDVEAAAKGRLVQVTYTVPKAKLRVVNAGVGDLVLGDDSDESDRAERVSINEVKRE